MSRTTLQESTILTSEEIKLLKKWQKRCEEGNFSEGVKGTRQIRVMGRSGDTPVDVPCITPHAALDNLSPEERFALEYADRLVRAYRARGRSVFSKGLIIEEFDPTGEEEMIVLSPIAGG